jgi:tRNA dimethylallyltransferase
LGKKAMIPPSKSAERCFFAFVMKRLIVIGGATATGKTAAAIQLARRYDWDILSADSRQFYREMSIGTAKPTPDELTQARHHFVDSLSVTDPYTVGDFERDALALLDQIYTHREGAILTGGSGLFIQALCEGLNEFPAVDEATKQYVAEGEATGGIAWLQAQLAHRDPQYLQQAPDLNNPARLRRALEVSMAAGQPYSGFLGREKAKRPFEVQYFRLEMPRADLYQRIDARVDQMIADGLEQEAQALLPHRHLPALRTVGYEEWFDYFDGKMNYAETIEKIKQHSRNYAKRQATWFAKHGNWTGINAEQLRELGWGAWV